MTASSSYNASLSMLLNTPVFNGGVGGETSIEIAARQNGTPATVTPSGGAIPASGSVDVTSVIPTAQGTQYISGTLADVRGTIFRNPDGTRYFTRQIAGSLVSIPSGAQFVTDIGLAYKGTTAIIWSGRNNNGQLSQVQADIASMVAYHGGSSSRYVITSVCNGNGETTGTSAHTNITALNSALSSTYGLRFLDIRRYLIDNGLAALGITPTSQDNADVAGDTIPGSLRSDNVHLTSAANGLVAQQVYVKLQELGWVWSRIIWVPLCFQRVAAYDAPTDQIVLSVVDAGGGHWGELSGPCSPCPPLTTQPATSRGRSHARANRTALLLPPPVRPGMIRS